MYIRKGRAETCLGRVFVAAVSYVLCYCAVCALGLFLSFQETVIIIITFFVY